jgi:F0F1-type ATP synthase membrane subunit b/b'
MLQLLEERDKRIAGRRKEAETLQASGNEKSGIIDIRLEEARALALEERKEMRNEGQKVYSEVVEKARKQAQEKLQGARDDIEVARFEAAQELKREADVLASLVVEQVLERPGGAA